MYTRIEYVFVCMIVYICCTNTVDMLWLEIDHSRLFRRNLLKNEFSSPFTFECQIFTPLRSMVLQNSRALCIFSASFRPSVEINSTAGELKAYLLNYRRLFKDFEKTQQKL